MRLIDMFDPSIYDIQEKIYEIQEKIYEIQEKIIKDTVKAEKIGTKECAYRKTIQCKKRIIENVCTCIMPPYLDMPLSCPATGDICKLFDKNWRGKNDHG